MEKMKLSTPDLTQKNIEKLSKLFPNVVKEGKVDFELLKQMLSHHLIDDCRERYGLNWVGKKKSILRANIPIKKTLRPLKEKSVDFEKTKNIYIEGDNLETLKIIQESYLGKIKMIYIDPPYNTGKDFIYKDNFKQNKSEYNEASGAIDEEGVKLFRNTLSNGRFHSDWLSMMYERLLVARDLLREDGVIFISIDDNEVHNLRHICDEIFGEGNFVANIIWQKKFSRSNDAKFFSTMHDHILCYGKNFDKTNINLLPRDKEIPNGYSNPDNDERGVWTSVILSAKSGTEKLIYEIETPSGKKVLPPSGRYWSVTKERFQELVKDNRIWFGKNGDGIPRLKTFLSEVQDGLKPNTIWFYEEVGHTQEGRQEVKKIFDGLGIFDSPKPIRLIKQILQLSTSKNDIILDFFSGSATTAHAVMELNAEDGENRQFILVQLPEPTDEKSEAYKAGYKNICEIGKERIRRAGEKIIEKLRMENGEWRIKDLDIGFKVFKLDSTNIKEWDSNPDNLEKSLLDYGDFIKTGRSEEDLLYEVLLKYGIDLTAPIEKKEINGKKVYIVGFGSLIIYFDEIDIEIAKEIVNLVKVYESNFSVLVLKDDSFASSKDKVNIVEFFKQMNLFEKIITL